MEQPVIAIIGAGAVGSTTAYALMLRNVQAKLLLVDINQQKCVGEIEDLVDVLSMSETLSIDNGTLLQAGQADIIIITAGIAQKEGQTRLELLQTNYQIVQTIVNGMQPINQKAIIIVVTNPVDILTRVVQDIAGLPRTQIFGSGTLLDSNRLRCLISQRVHIDQRSIHAYVLGEHGDNQFVAWSTATVGDVPLATFNQMSPQVCHEMAIMTQRKAYEIISCKGFTSFGIATCIAAYCQDILADAHRVVPASCFVQELGVCLSMPIVLGKAGITEILRPSLDDAEQKMLEKSVEVLQATYQQLKS